MQTIKIFLGSSNTELYDERLHLGDYLMNSVRPIFKNGDIDIEIVKCEDIHSGNTGENPQERIDNLLKECDVSIFMFKTKAGKATVHEFDVARELQKSKRHEIYVFCFDVPEEKKEESLKDFQKRLEKEEFYWYECKDITDIESQFILGLLKYERQLLGLTKPSVVEQESEAEKDGDTLFANFMQDEQKQAQMQEVVHKNIEDLMQQTQTVMADEDETIAARIFKVIELYKKADQWALASDYDIEKYVQLLYDYAQFLRKYGLYKDAEAVYLRQIPFAEVLYGKEAANTAESYNEIGVVYNHLGEYENALKFHFKALEIREKNFGTEHPFTATSYNNIGVVYRRLGEYEKALEYYKKALEIREKVLGKEHPDTATTYNNIGGVYDYQGNYVEALEYYKKALAITEHVLGTKHPSTATSYNNIGFVSMEQGDYSKALEYFQKALEISENSLGKEHPDTATTYGNIGFVCKERGDYAQALEYYFKALAIREKTLGKEHPDIVQSYNAIGQVYRELGDFDKSVKYYNKALTISKKLPDEIVVDVGGGTIDLSSTYDNTGKAYKSQSKVPKKSGIVDQRQDNKSLESSTSNKLDTAISYNNIGEVLNEKGDYPKAMRNFLKALPILEELRGEEHADTAMTYNGMGYVYYHQGNFAKAQEYLNKAYQIRQKLFGVNDADTEETSLLLEIVNVLMAYV